MSNSGPNPSEDLRSLAAPVHGGEHYESAKGCLLLSLLILFTGVICVVVGTAINAYIDAAVS